MNVTSVDSSHDSHAAATAIVVAVLTSILTRKREQEADWRKLKFAQYREFILALSCNVQGRATPETQRRYSDAVNSMSLVAPPPVLHAVHAFQNEISYMNMHRNQDEHDRLLNDLLHAMRADIYPTDYSKDPRFSFLLLGIPPESTNRYGSADALPTIGDKSVQSGHEPGDNRNSV